MVITKVTTNDTNICICMFSFDLFIALRQLLVKLFNIRGQYILPYGFQQRTVKHAVLTQNNGEKRSNYEKSHIFSLKSFPLPLFFGVLKSAGHILLADIFKSIVRAKSFMRKMDLKKMREIIFPIIPFKMAGKNQFLIFF